MCQKRTSATTVQVTRHRYTIFYQVKPPNIYRKYPEYSYNRFNNSYLFIHVCARSIDFAENESAAQVLDINQVPAFLCRQSDLIRQISQTQKPVNIKKGQFLAPWDISNVVEKITATGNQQILITERGTMFGYNNLVVDFRSIMIMRDTGYPIIFDATHSIQLPGGAGKSSGGQREYAPLLARAAVAAGVDGIFLEVHKDPDQALCDGPNSLKLDDLESLLPQLLEIRKAISP